MTTKKGNTKNELAEVESADLIALDFSADVGSGMEDADADSYAIPFLRVLQKGSPQVDETQAEFREDAKAGMLMNTVTGELFDGKEGVIFLPCHYQRRFIHWGPRGAEDGGYKGEVLPEKAAALRDDGEVVPVEGKLVFPRGDSTDPKKCDILADTRNHFGLMINEATGAASQVLLSLTSTQIKKSKQLMAALNGVRVKSGGRLVTPPTWVNRIRVKTRAESNQHGSWFGVVLEPEGFINDQDLYELGREFHDAVAGGKVEVRYEEPDSADGPEDDSEGF